MKVFRNREGIEEFFIDPLWHQNRVPGVSCFMRVKNEAEFIVPSILSIIDHVQEVVVALQPSKDGTKELILGIANPKIRLLDYPFEMWPNGPGFKAQDAASVHCKCYYYNWTLSKTCYDYAIKWDGDMVALPGMARHIQRGADIRFFGHEIVRIVRNGNWVLSKTHACSNAAPSGLFKIRPPLEYVKGDRTHRFNKIPGRAVRGQFLHFKWCKAHYSQAWAKDWRNGADPGFRRILMRALPGKVYAGPRPSLLDQWVDRDMGVADEELKFALAGG